MLETAKFVRRWEFDGQEFKSKREVTEYRSRQALASYSTVDQLIAGADTVIALLKPFATPKKRTRKAKAANGPAVDAPTGRKSGKPAEAHV